MVVVIDGMQVFIKGSWEAIFRVTDDFYSMMGGVKLYMHEGWCETLHRITIHS
jgi:hypothetical protein